MAMLFVQKLKFLVLAGATAALVACGGGGGGGTPTTINGNVTGNVSAANVAALSGAVFAFPGGLADLGTTAATTLTFGGTAAAPTATVTSGGVSAVADVAFGSCKFTYKVAAFGKASGYTFTYNICEFSFRTNGFNVGSTVQIPTTLKLNTLISTPINLSTFIGAGGALTTNGNSVGGGTLIPVTGATGGGS